MNRNSPLMFGLNTGDAPGQEGRHVIISPSGFHHDLLEILIKKINKK